jgi:hypothetical protein
MIRVSFILINDLPRLTEYGYGYLLGLIIMLIIFTSISFWLGKKYVFKKKN